MPTNAETRAGLFAAIAAYGLWGFLPLYFQFLGDLPPLVILAHRIVWSVPTALILIIAAGKWGEFAGVFRAPRMLFTLLGVQHRDRDQLDDLHLGRHQSSRARRQPRLLHQSADRLPLRRHLLRRALPPAAASRRRHRRCRRPQPDAGGRPVPVGLAVAGDLLRHLRRDPQDHEGRQPHRLRARGALALRARRSPT